MTNPWGVEEGSGDAGRGQALKVGMPPHRSSYLLILAYIGTSPLISVRPRENNTLGLFSSKKTDSQYNPGCVYQRNAISTTQHTSGYRHKIVFLRNTLFVVNLINLSLLVFLPLFPKPPLPLLWWLIIRYFIHPLPTPCPLYQPGIWREN